MILGTSREERREKPFLMFFVVLAWPKIRSLMFEDPLKASTKLVKQRGRPQRCSSPQNKHNQTNCQHALYTQPFLGEKGTYPPNLGNFLSSHSDSEQRPSSSRTASDRRSTSLTCRSTAGRPRNEAQSSGWLRHSGEGQGSLTVAFCFRLVSSVVEDFHGMSITSYSWHGIHKAPKAVRFILGPIFGFSLLLQGNHHRSHSKE